MREVGVRTNGRKTSGILTALLALALAWLSYAPAGAGDMTLTDDAFTSSAQPTTNYGAQQTLHVTRQLGAPAAQVERGFLKFDLTGLHGTASADVAKATLTLFVTSVGTPGAFNVFAVTGGWTERALTQATAPALAPTPEPGSPVQVTAADQHTYLTFDLTSLVKDWLDNLNGVQTSTD